MSDRIRLTQTRPDKPAITVHLLGFARDLQPSAARGREVAAGAAGTPEVLAGAGGILGEVRRRLWLLREAAAGAEVAGGIASGLW